MDFANILASSGITGAIVISLYITYKICYKKKLKSKCCFGEFQMEEQITTINVTPQLQPEKPKDELEVSNIPNL